MKHDKLIKTLGAGIAAVGFVFVIPFMIVKVFSLDPGSEELMKEKYGCKPTNEFVGKNATRLWMCADGLKYKETAFAYWAYQEKRQKRGF